MTRTPEEVFSHGTGTFVFRDDPIQVPAVHYTVRHEG